MEDPTEPVRTMERRYPGTIRINRKNAITPIIMTYLLSNSMPIGTIAAKRNRTNKIGSLAMFLKGYLKEFDIIFPTSIVSPHLNMNTGFFS
jgi:hypothetical protein